MYWGSQIDWQDEVLSDRDIQLMMWKENNQTLLLKFADSVADVFEDKWYIKKESPYVWGVAQTWR